MDKLNDKKPEKKDNKENKDNTDKKVVKKIIVNLN